MQIHQANKILKNLMTIQGINCTAVSMFEANDEFMVVCHVTSEEDAARAKMDLLASKAFRKADVRKATTMSGKPYWAVEAVRA